MKRIYKILTNISIIVGFSALVFLAFYFLNFQELIKTTRLSSEISSFLTGSTVIIFISFILLFLLKCLFSNTFYKYVKDSINNPIHIVVICVILTVILPKISFKSSSNWFNWKYFIIIFTYLFAIITIYLRMFFSK